MSNNVYGIDLGTNNFKVYSKATGKTMLEKNTIAVIESAFETVTERRRDVSLE